MKKFTHIFNILSCFTLSMIHHVEADPMRPKWDFQGQFLVVASDADMLASAYENGKLGPRNGSDKLSLIPLDAPPNEYQAYSVEASNSVAGPPSVFDVSPNGDFAFIIETFTPRPGKSDDETFADLKHGNTLTIVDIRNPKKPKTIDQQAILERPLSVNINKDGTLLAVSYHQQGAGSDTPISLHKIARGKILSTSTPEIPGWTQGEELIDVVWHPQKNILAMINTTDASVRFMTVKDNKKDFSLEPWGNVISVGKKPFIGRFTKNGEHFLVNNLFWGEDVAGHWTEAPRGTIANIHLAHIKKNGSPVHSLTSQVLVGPSPEGFAVSPDGRFVASVNMERSWLPYDDARQTWFSSITLINRDPKTGAMTELDTTPYYGVLPEMAVFDASSQYLAVVKYDHYDHSKPGGAVDFFKIVHDPLDKQRQMLVQTNYSVPVQHGAHDMMLVE